MFRDPFPIEKFENDNTFGNREKHRHVVGKEDPFQRLAYTHTLQSQRRTRDYHDPQAPRDSLDFVIKTTHVPWKFNASKNEVLVQRETLGIDTGRKLKNRTVEEKLAFDPADPPIRVTVHEKQVANSKDGNQLIRGHHGANTNRGYVRKVDGGFYSL
ncbi:Oidioi.mRNA.OKI2018_I69.chr1.g3000.t1.cds [Oikopleura dioica]|uniref:Oidioi.mRNA.OKI2018_I69.chr1.g3000.t1.cds n=1 Tax=Oikopleura dioica TaxID=34765 RepID=A0ABN7SZP1_OIKDI|nr:Oidioi.mRNA.OKI2018_I69.chr1.g3000.t1.cds [Oikopleura dioica]